MLSFYELNFWKRSHELCLKIYNITRDFPKPEVYGVTSQIRRSSSSVPTNIAEGCGRRSKKEFGYFLNIACGSLSEVEYQLILSKDLNYISEEISKLLINEVIEIRKMIYTYISRIQN